MKIISQEVPNHTAREAPKQDDAAAMQPKSLWQRAKHSVQAAMPDWVHRNSSRINQLGLMAGTMVIMGSVFRNRTISQDIFNAQEKILMDKGFHGDALKTKIDELLQSKVIKKPGLHKWRMVYLPTAILGLAVGGFLKDKETPEEREAHRGMSTPSYIGMRLKHALDPAHHSRQTAGVIGALSGVFAILSAFTQPGGVLISEAFVGATLISGFSCLTLINDPASAKRWLNMCWASRLPFVMTGTYETLIPKPGFTNPLAAEIKKSDAFRQGIVEAFDTGVKVPPLQRIFGPSLGVFGKKLVKGGAAVEAFAKQQTSLALPYKRMDVSYPIGQWFNMALATFGFLMAGSDDKKNDPAKSNTIVADLPTNQEKRVQEIAASVTEDQANSVSRSPTTAQDDATTLKTTTASATPSTKIANIERAPHPAHGRIEGTELTKQMHA